MKFRIFGLLVIETLAPGQSLAGSFRDLMPSPIDLRHERDAEMITRTLRNSLRASLTIALAMLAPIAVDASTLTTSYSFIGGSAGGGRRAGLIVDSTGALYGTAGGTVFKLTPPTQVGGTWRERVLYSFTGGSDGDRSCG